MAIRFFFEYNRQLIQLPVNPGEIKINSPGNNSTMEIVKLGEINTIKKPKLAECVVESFLPVDKFSPLVLTGGMFRSPQFYINWFEKVRKYGKPMRFLVSDTKINMLVSIENFEYWLEAQDDDYHFKLQLKEYKPHKAKEVKLTNDGKIIKKSNEQQSRDKTGYAIGDAVIVNGKYRYDSYGSEPSGTFKNFEGRISHIVADRTRPYRYHITTPTGGYRGWVAQSQLSHK